MNDNYFSCLLVGDYGTGKTTVATTAPKPVLILDMDNKAHKMVNIAPLIAKGDVIQWPIDVPLSKFGLTRLATMDSKPGSRVAVQRPDGYLKLAKMIEHLEATKCVIGTGDPAEGFGGKVATVVLDSYTSTDEHLRRLLMSVNGTASMTLPLFGALLANMEELNSTLLRLPANIIIICHEKIDKDDLTGKITYRPLIHGQMSNKIGMAFEEVYATIKTFKGSEVKYELLTVGDSMRSCRTSRALDARAVPDFDTIYKENSK